MQDFRKRRSIRAELLRAALSTAGVLILGALTFFAVRGAWGMYQKFTRASDASAAAAARLVDLEDRYDAVKAKVAALESARGVEAELRGRYGVALPGEGEITVVRQAGSSTSTEAEVGGFWGKLWHALFVW